MPEPIPIPPHHAAPAVWAGAGWGPVREWPATALDGTPLTLSLRLPRGWEDAEITPGEEPARALAEFARMPGRITMQLFLLRLQQGGAEQRVVLTATFALGDPQTSADPQASSDPRAEPGAGATSVRVAGYQGHRTRSVGRAQPEPMTASVPALVISFRLQTPFGPLLLTFASPQPGVHVAVEPVIDAIAATVALVPAV